MQPQEAKEVGGYRSREKAVLERESFREIQPQEAIEVRGYKSMGWEKAVLERESFRVKQRGVLRGGRWGGMEVVWAS